MKYTLLILSVLIPFALKAQTSFEYISPKPGSSLVSRQNNIIIRKGSIINREALPTADVIRVTGSNSGEIKGKLFLSDDDKTLVYEPAKEFAPAEKVTVSYSSGIVSKSGSDIGSLSFSFTVTPLSQRLAIDGTTRKYLDEYQEEMPLNSASKSSEGNSRLQGIQRSMAPADSIPADFPVIRIDTSNNPSPGNFFLTVSNSVSGIGYYNYIIDNNGRPVKYMKKNHYTYDFKMQPNRLFSYADVHSTYVYAGGGETTHRIIDSAFTEVDTFQCGNGYTADSHEFRLLPNGHALMCAYDLQPVNMSLLVSGGNPGALVYGSIMQELDKDKHVVFQWRSWDYIPILDSYNNLTQIGFDYIHVNAFNMDKDGNILIGSRLLCEVTKINRTTGEIMWRMGGKHNQFTFINEHPENAPTYFSHAHGLRILPNGNYIMFDNGLLHSPAYSRAVEYKIDEINKTATMVWEYRHSPDIYSATQGDAQRLENGNTLVNWGSATAIGSRAVTEVTPDNNIALEFSLPTGLQSYRIWKFPFLNYIPAATVILQELQQGVLYNFKNVTQNTGISLFFNQYQSGYNMVMVKKHANSPLKPDFPGDAPFIAAKRAVITSNGIASFNADIIFDSTYTDELLYPAQTVVYAREFEGQGMFFPLTTYYSAAAKTLTVTANKFGEFIFAAPGAVAAPGIPKTFKPAMNEPVNQEHPVDFGFSTKGIVNQFHIVVAKDSFFTQIISADSTLLSSVYQLQNPEANTTYYWKVRANNQTGWSNWSDISTFRTAPAYVTVVKPNGGEQWTKKKLNFIEWKDNLTEPVKIELYRNGIFYSLLKDSAASSGGYAWTISDTLTSDSTYKIKISSLANPSVYSQTSGMFSIVSATGVADLGKSPKSFVLLQNYPNPFNPGTNISFVIPSDGFVTLTVYDVLGSEVQCIYSGETKAGYHEINFDAGKYDSGVYFYQLKTGNEIMTKKMMLVK